MDLATFHRRREQTALAQPRYRVLCSTCLQPDFSCFCAWLKPFDPGAVFAILTHPIEVRRRIATGRMSHLMLHNSALIQGHTFTQSHGLNEILNNPNYCCLMLYPGRNSTNLSALPLQSRTNLIAENKKPYQKLVIVVIDGTWGSARTMVNQSTNLQNLNRICFTPPHPSNFRVRKQPRIDCYSTVEAIHYTLELLGPAIGFDTESRQHDRLLDVFDRMVNRQLDLAHSSTAKSG